MKVVVRSDEKQNQSSFFKFVLTAWSCVLLESHQSLSYSRISKNFMEPEVSLPCSQESFTDPYPEPDESSPYHSILFF
jgi:hypothetical protein